MPSSADDGAALADAVRDAEDRLLDEAGCLLSDVRRLLYLSIPPSAVSGTVEMLAKKDLVDRSRLVAEKPFGTDLATARALDVVLRNAFEESQIFRIDHFLGKEAVQNILALRFANGLFEPAWNRHTIESVQIDVPEKLTVEGRGSFYEGTGCLRDMVTTHLCQLLGFVALEDPHAYRESALRAAKAAVFAAVRPLDPDRVVFGQYDGYRDEPDVAEDSDVETLVAIEMWIDNDRWRDVPFYLRTGKAMADGRGRSRSVSTTRGTAGSSPPTAATRRPTSWSSSSPTSRGSRSTSAPSGRGPTWTSWRACSGSTWCATCRTPTRSRPTNGCCST